MDPRDASARPLNGPWRPEHEVNPSIEHVAKVFDVEPGREGLFGEVVFYDHLKKRIALVVAVLRLEHALLEADVASDVVARGQQLVGGQQAGQVAVAVRDGVHREEVEHQRRDQDQRMRTPLALGRVVAVEQLGQQKLRLLPC